MKNAFRIALICLAPWLAPAGSKADPFGDCADRIQTNPDCVLAIADALATRYRSPDFKRAEAAEMLIEAGRIAAALRLVPMIGSESEQYQIDELILSFYARERRLIEAEAYVAALPEDPPKWAKHKTRRTGNTRRNFPWIWAQDAPEADVLETLDWVTGKVPDPADRARITASLIPTLARQGHLDHAYDELHAYMAFAQKAPRRRYGFDPRTQYLRFLGSFEPSPLDRAADLVWVALLKGRRDIADRLDEELRAHRSWESELREILRVWTAQPDRFPASAGSSAAIDLIDFAQQYTEPRYGGDKSSSHAHYIEAGILIRLGEFERALRVEIEDRRLRASYLHEAAKALAEAGRLQDASDIIEANRAVLDEEFGASCVTELLRA